MDIVLTAGFDKGVFCNGLQQNIVFLAELLKDIGHEPILCLNHDLDKSIDAPENIMTINRKDLIKLNNIDYVLQTGWVVENVLIDKLKEIHPKLKNIHIHYGNRMLADIEQAPRDNICVGNHGVDEVWISPHYEISTQYFKTFYNTQKVFILPYIWSPKYVQAHERIWNTAGESCYYNPGRPKNIAIVEPNLNITKSCIPAIMAAEELLNFEEDSFDKLIVYCSAKMAKKRYFRSLMWCLNLAKKNKIYFDSRQKISKVFAKECSIVLSHQLLNALNYTYLEALYFNIPVVHNSEYIKEAGYYYADYNTQDAAAALKSAISFHDKNLDQYKEEAAKVLWRYSPENPLVKERYRKLFA